MKNTTTTSRTTEPIAGMPAAQLAERIACGDITAREAVEAHIERIERVNKHLNAVVVKRYEAARREADAADQRRRSGEPLGRLHGVPITVKESLDLAGTASTFGLATRAAHRATADELHVHRLREAGGIVLGKTNVAQLLFYYESDNPHYGRTNNPWKQDRTAGGSSGGEAAIIASGGSAMGVGTDIGGSVRIPAAFCGIASIKPTAGRTPDPGRFSVPIGQNVIQSQVGVLARTVEDVALGLTAIADRPVQTPAPTAPMPPVAPLGDHRSVDVAALRVAFYTNDGSFDPSPAVERGVREAAAMLADAGAQVSAWAPPDAAYGMAMVHKIFCGDAGKGMKALLKGNRRAPQIAQLLSLLSLPRGVVGVMRGTMAMLGQHGLANGLRLFGHYHTDDYWKVVQELFTYQNMFREQLDAATGGPFDIILCPVSPLPAWTHGSSRDLVTGGAYSCLYNALGYPAGVVPVTRVRSGEESARPASRDKLQRTAAGIEHGSAGLPVAVQVVARPWSEHVALAAMAAIEKAASGRPGWPSTPILPA
ncbi:MAG TPA: amidase family protein [Candidatus Kapabacteria bacterium]|nr:amidase family protein [Candidatus Kapabacteria bacterium]